VKYFRPYWRAIIIHRKDDQELNLVKIERSYFRNQLSLTEIVVRLQSNNENVFVLKRHGCSIDIIEDLDLGIKSILKDLPLNRQLKVVDCIESSSYCQGISISEEDELLTHKQQI